MGLESVGRYRVTGKALPDRGGIRYPALDCLLERDVYLRTIPAALAEDADVRGHFLRQARHLSRLRHPNIASLLDVVEADGRVYQVLPREKGRCLAFAKGKAAPRPVAWTLGIAAELCDGLAYVHAEEVVHGRIHAGVVFLDESEHAVLHGFEPQETDFADPVLKVGMVVDNARYLAPEAVRRAKLDPRTDLFSLGVLIFHLLTGRYPQSQRDAVGVMEETERERALPRLARFLPDAPAAVDELVARLLEKDPALRPRGAQEVRAAIERALDPGAVDGPGSTIRLLGGGTGGLRGYAIEERIGRGAFGVVFRARERGTGRTVAVKILRPDVLDDPRTAARLRRETEAARSLDHPNVVRVLEWGQDADAHYTVMEFVEGPSLAEHLRKTGRLPWREAARLTATVLEALAHAHARAVIHRDLKPGNILLRGGATPVLLDFGMSHVASLTRLTHAGEVLGTPAYMAPEQLSGGPPDPRSDLWAIGVILYEALAGELPFTGDSLPALCRSVCEGTVRPLRERGADAPEALERLTLRLLDREPSARGSGAAEVARELAEIAG